MKKLLCLAIVSLFAFSACVTMHDAAVQGNLYSDVCVKSEIDTEAHAQMVEGKACARGIIGILTGDCSYKAALADAVAKAGAKGLKNIVVDTHVRSILGGIYVEYTTIVQGVPIK